MADDASRAVRVMEADENLAKILILNQVHHRSMAAGNEEADVTIGSLGHHGCEGLRMLELRNALDILESCCARAVIASKEHFVVGVCVHGRGVALGVCNDGRIARFNKLPDIYDDFLKEFVAAMQAVKPGDPFSADTDMGPLSTFAQRDLVLGQIEEAKRTGARLLTGGEKLDGKGAYLTAGVLVDVPTDSSFIEEEIFGPVAMVFKAADVDDAIRIANSSPYGLGSSVWTNDPAEQARFAQEIEAGMTAFNQILMSSPEAPFGGIKRSGHGRELGSLGLYEFVNAKTVIHAS